MKNVIGQPSGGALVMLNNKQYCQLRILDSTNDDTIQNYSISNIKFKLNENVNFVKKKGYYL